MHFKAAPEITSASPESIFFTNQLDINMLTFFKMACVAILKNIKQY